MNERPDAHAALASFLATAGSYADVLDKIAAIATGALPAVTMASMTMLGESGEPVTTVATDRAVPEVDEAQYRSGRGPCLEAWRTGQPVALHVVAEADDRYPEFVVACKAHGVRSSLSLPVVADGSCVGSLNLYARTEDGFGNDAARIADQLAAAASAVLIEARSLTG